MRWVHGGLGPGSGMIDALVEVTVPELAAPLLRDRAAAVRVDRADECFSGLGGIAAKSLMPPSKSLTCSSFDWVGSGRGAATSVATPPTSRRGRQRGCPRAARHRPGSPTPGRVGGVEVGLRVSRDASQNNARLYELYSTRQTSLDAAELPPAGVRNALSGRK